MPSLQQQFPAVAHSCKFIVLLILLLLVAYIRSAVHVDPSSHMFIETETGRELYFHGVNVVYKAFPYIPRTDIFDAQYSFAEADYQILKQLGLNIVRLGVMWPGVEPTRNNYNETYLDQMDAIIASLEKHGIYVLLDFHQDVFSEKFCGEGVPSFAAIPTRDVQHKDFPYPLTSKPYNLTSEGIPSAQDCAQFNWDQYYLTQAVASAYQNFYDDKDKIMSVSFAQYWQTVAKRFLKRKNVIGYDLMNEPFAGDIFMKPSLLVPGAADRLNLQNMYEIVHQAIRKVDDEKIVFIEGVTWDEFAVGFNETPGGVNYRNRTALSYHYYTPPMLSASQAFRARQYDLDRLQIGGMLTEFDISYNNGINIPHLRETLDFADHYKQSWIGWEYKPYVPITGWGWCLINPNGTINEPVAREMSRTYAYVVAGSVVSTSFNTSTGDFYLSFRTGEGADATARTTEIYVNQELYYSQGVDIVVTPKDMVEVRAFAEDKQTVKLITTASAKKGSLVNVQILSRRPKQ